MEETSTTMKSTIVGIILLLTIICSKVFTNIIIKYYRKKAPGHQSLIDYFFIDFLHFYSFTKLICTIVLYFGLFNFEYIKPYETSAYILSGLTEAIMLFTLCKLLTFLCLKYLSIYQNSMLSDLEEEELNKILTRIQTSVSLIFIFLEYFVNFYDKNKFMVYNVLTNGNGEGGMPAMVMVPIILLCVIMALVLQIRIEIDNYHYGDNAGCFLKLIQKVKKQENEGKYLQKYGFLMIVMIVFAYIIFFAFLPTIEMSKFRVLIVGLVFVSLFDFPPILFILTHQNIKKFALKLFRQKMSDVSENLTKVSKRNLKNRNRVHSLVV